MLQKAAMKLLIRLALKKAGQNPKVAGEYSAFKKAAPGARVDIEGVVNGVKVDGIEADLGIFFIRR